MKVDSADILLNIVKHIDYRFDFLRGIVYRKAVDDCMDNGISSTVLKSSQEIQSYLSSHDIDMIILTCPVHMPVVFGRTGQEWVKRTGNLSDWITSHWHKELLIIAVS
jgi:hypothetical protein